MSESTTPAARPRVFRNEDLRGATFRGCDLSEVVMRGVDVAGAEIDAPWLAEGAGPLVVNGVDVTGYVDGELNRRFPGREERKATDPEGLRSAWSRLEEAWAATGERVAGLAAGAVDVSIAGEWSYAQTLRHLIMATDTWLGRGIQELREPYHPVGQPNGAYSLDGGDMSVFSEEAPSFEDVLQVRAGRVAMVRDFIEAVSAEDLAGERKNPWSPEYPETVLSCLHTILEEEWEHHRYAVRDLDVIEAAESEDGPMAE